MNCAEDVQKFDLQHPDTTPTYNDNLLSRFQSLQTGPLKNFPLRSLLNFLILQASKHKMNRDGKKNTVISTIVMTVQVLWLNDCNHRPGFYLLGEAREEVPLNFLKTTMLFMLNKMNMK